MLQAQTLNPKIMNNTGKWCKACSILYYGVWQFNCRCKRECYENTFTPVSPIRKAQKINYSCNTAKWWVWNFCRNNLEKKKKKEEMSTSEHACSLGMINLNYMFSFLNRNDVLTLSTMQTSDTRSIFDMECHIPPPEQRWTKTWVFELNNSTAEGIGSFFCVCQ